MARYKSPTGSPIIGAAEVIRVTAIILGITDEGEPVYSGESEVEWDTQAPIEDDGKIIFVDAEGVEWTFDELVKDDGR